MALLAIKHYPDPVLKQVAEPVDAFDGSAAPQVGVARRLAVVDCSGSDEPAQLFTLVNPEIVHREGDSCEEEGCLSVPAYYAKVDRSARVRVRYFNLDGVVEELEADGLLAIAIQHEIDHLDGILFVDHLSPLKKGIFRKKYKKIMEQQREQL